VGYILTSRTSARPEDQCEGLNGLDTELLAHLKKVNGALKPGNSNILVEVSPVAQRIGTQIKQLRRKHLDDLSHGGVPPLVNVALLASLNAYARVLDHAQNIAEAISGEK
jgi:phosphate:Na+ symporter